MKKIKYLLVLVVLLTSCQMDSSIENEQGDYLYSRAPGSSPDKKVVMVMIDSLMGSTLDESLEEGSVPALEYLIENGQYYKDLVAPFPSMSVTVESTLITGEMPDKHRVPGLSWFKQDEDRIVNYGSNWEFWRENGLSQGLYDVLYNLNNEHLNKDIPTVFDDLDAQGFTSGAVNTVLYRGNTEHTLDMPPLTEQLSDLPGTIETKGPDNLSFGRLKKPDGFESEAFTDGIFNRAGLVDKYSMEAAQRLIKNNRQPDFLLLFFPDNDKETHKHGSLHRDGFEKADGCLQGILNSYGSWEKALEENVFIIFGDHAQNQLNKTEEETAIDLESLYGDYYIADLGDPVSEGDIGLGVNQRMAYIYDLHNRNLIPSLAGRALNNPEIDIAAWLEDGWVKVMSPGHNGELRFKRDGEITDSYGQNWTVQGNEKILDLNKKGESEISYGDYPDGLNHLETALKSHEPAKLVLTARPGHSFYADGIAVHEDGGEHGGLHKNDLLGALVIAGTDQEPATIRIVDLKNYILNLFEDME
ncbi:Type I phosphodiesterase / nucleotide pyrophosphatase [Salipaludibacillus aurantiacus]|uniref:Type I phosphodiesterase / nucleotide pyrophosphatase n=2 Tax=Salipaludibacillus aurantiacus TaxID=1601833 RepID=A0A1H9SC40_9BACI|nr:Type I phosphodiesterase / nucleotide pyrophosphatase [Salipaludibacillus aurantiacus]